MANWIALQVDTEPLKPGVFYNALVDKNGTTVLFETMTIKRFDFENIEYFECPDNYDGYSPFHIWKKIKTNSDIERFEDITSGCKVLKIKKDSKEYIAFETNQPITGYIQFG